MITGLEETELLRWIIFNSDYIHGRMNPITSLWLESSFRSMLLIHGQQLSRHIWTLSDTISQGSGQKHIKDWQTHWQWIQMLMQRTLVNG